MAASQTQLFARFPSVLHAASSQRGRGFGVGLNAPLIPHRLSNASALGYTPACLRLDIFSWLAARGKSIPGSTLGAVLKHGID